MNVLWYGVGAGPGGGGSFYVTLSAAGGEEQSLVDTAFPSIYGKRRGVELHAYASECPARARLHIAPPPAAPPTPHSTLTLVPRCRLRVAVRRGARRGVHPPCVRVGRDGVLRPGRGWEGG